MSNRFWHWGRDGFSYKNSGKSVLLFEAAIADKKVTSD